jgi:hypothetical protein
MVDVHVVELAARQHNRFSRDQLAGLQVDDSAIHSRVRSGRWVQVHEAVYAIAPVLPEDRGRWMAATLTEPGSVLSHASAAAAWRIWDRSRTIEVITRPGSGGPRRVDGLLVHRSETLDGDVASVGGIPVTSVPRTLIDLAPHVSVSALARLVREALRLGLTTVAEVVDALATKYRGRRGSRRLATVLARYSGLPVDRCRSATEVRALEVLRDAGRPAPDVNRKIAGVEADLSWRTHRLIVELDGPDFHLDQGEDARKQACWEAAGWEVRRLPSPAVYEAPDRLLAVTSIVERP